MLRANLVESLLRDIRFGMRMLAKSPGSTLVILLSLSLGSGANTAIFSLINTLVLRRLPVQQPEQLVEIMSRYPGEPRVNAFSRQSYEHYRDHNHVFAGLIGTSGPSRLNVRSEGLEPEILNGEYVVGNFFPVLGVKPAIGRLLGPEDDRKGAGSMVAVVSWSYWKRRFNLDPAILGKPIMVENLPATIVGVTPPPFSGLLVGSKTDVWLPSKPSGPLGLIGRLKPGVSIEQARAEMTALFQFTIAERTRGSKDPLVRQLKVEVEAAGNGLSLLRDQFAKPLLLLMVVVGLLLLIACTNVASLLLARGAARQREMAVRAALGAGRFRLVRQVLTESLLLSAGGSLLGVFLAYFGANTLVRILESGRQMPGLPLHLDIQVRPDGHVLLFTAGVALLTGMLFGLAPAWNAFTSPPASSLREIGRIGETRFSRLFGKSLVVAQVALSVVLVSTAVLFVRHLSNLQHLDLGFRRDHVLLVALDSSRSGYGSEQLSRLSRELLERLEAIPGVRSATLCGVTPISGAGAASFATVEGRQEKPEDRRYISINWVAPKYFETFGTPFLSGRDFSFEDEGRQRVAIVNRAMARYYFADGNPIGKHVALDRDWKGFGEDKAYEIVGVVGDAKYSEIREAAPRTIYFNAFQEGHVFSQFALRTSVEPSAVAPEVRRTARELLKTVPVAKVTTLSEQVDASIVPERLIATLSAWFGALGGMLTAVGLYGLLAYTVARRINEIGIRLALGASQSHILRMVLRDALGMVTVGMAIGIPIAFWCKSFAISLIPDLPAKSAIPIAFGGVAMVIVALLAAYVPARRAAQVDPMDALRYE
jgi:putative ABC transport system permease protein